MSMAHQPPASNSRLAGAGTGLCPHWKRPHASTSTRFDTCLGASIIEHMAAVLEAACQHMNRGAWGFDVALRLHLYFLTLWP